MSYELFCGDQNIVAETPEMLEFCARHNIPTDVEVIPIQKVNEAYERLLKSDVKCRLSIWLHSSRIDQRLLKGKKQMQKGRLGKSNGIGLGCKGVRYVYGPAGDGYSHTQRSRTGHNILRYCRNGRSVHQRLVGEALTSYRHQVVIATKVGIKIDPTGFYFASDQIVRHRT